MSETRPWDKQPGEPPFWFHRFERYRLLGPDRSLLAAFNQWRHEKSRKVTTWAPRSWAEARDRWNWVERAQAWDEHVASEVAARVEAERIEILSSGFAQQHERVRALGEVAATLYGEVRDPELRWSAGRNRDQFSGALLRELRGALADIAAEMGERVQGMRVMGKDGGPLDVSIREVIVNLRHEPEQEALED